MARPQHKAEFNEGPEAVCNFNTAMKRILSVSPDEMRRRLEADQRAKELSKSKAEPDQVE